jgi:hypothetical protein
VHIYRLVSEHTIEESILRKSNQKRHLDHLAIQSGGFTTAGLLSASAGGGGGSSAGDIRDFLGPDLLGRAGVKVSEEEYKDAIAQVEDADDAAAAAYAEKEAAEANEMNAEDFEERGAGAGAGAGAGGAGGGGGTGTAGPSSVEVARGVLRPIETYAVRVRCWTC